MAFGAIASQFRIMFEEQLEKLIWTGICRSLSWTVFRKYSNARLVRIAHILLVENTETILKGGCTAVILIGHFLDYHLCGLQGFICDGVIGAGGTASVSLS